MSAPMRGSRVLLLCSIALAVMFIFVGAGRPPYPRFDGFTPYGPIAIALVATIGTMILVQRLTHNMALGFSAGMFLMTLALLALAQIATIAYVPAGLFLVLALAGFVAGWAGRRSSGRRTP